MKVIVKQLFTILIMAFAGSSIAQNTTSNSKFLLGAEVGMGISQSDYLNYSQKMTLQGGVLGEYIFDKNFSLMGKIRYYESEVKFSSSEIIGRTKLGYKYETFYNHYNGKIISIPIVLNYNFKIYKNFSGSLKIGPTLDTEISRHYNYEDKRIDQDNSKFFVGLTFGANLNYKTPRVVYFVGLEQIYGANRGTYIVDNQRKIRHPMRNYFINAGVKFPIK